MALLKKNVNKIKLTLNAWAILNFFDFIDKLTRKSTKFKVYIITENLCTILLFFNQINRFQFIQPKFFKNLIFIEFLLFKFFIRYFLKIKPSCLIALNFHQKWFTCDWVSLVMGVSIIRILRYIFLWPKWYIKHKLVLCFNFVQALFTSLIIVTVNAFTILITRDSCLKTLAVLF